MELKIDLAAISNTSQKRRTQPVITLSQHTHPIDAARHAADLGNYKTLALHPHTPPETVRAAAGALGIGSVLWLAEPTDDIRFAQVAVRTEGNVRILMVIKTTNPDREEKIIPLVLIEKRTLVVDSNTPPASEKAAAITFGLDEHSLVFSHDSVLSKAKELARLLNIKRFKMATHLTANAPPLFALAQRRNNQDESESAPTDSETNEHKMARR